MRALCWKELRLASDVVLGSLLLFLLSFPLACLGIAMQDIRPFPWISALAGGCILNQYTMVLTSALLGAAAFAREREEGNYHFLASLPLSRACQYWTKLSAGLGLWLALWIVNAGILVAITLTTGQGLAPLLAFLPRILGVAALSFASLALAQLAGCRIASVTGATFCGGAMLLAIATLRWLIARVNDAPYFSVSFQVFLLGLGVLAMGLAGLGFVRGTDRRGSAKLDSTSGSTRMPPRNPWAALLWKDVRRLRVPLLAGLVMLALPGAAAITHGLLVGELATTLRTAALLTMALGWLVLPVWAGAGLAGEWPANTHLFLAGLPIAPGRILGARLLTTLAPALVASLVMMGVFLATQSQIPKEPTLHLGLTWEDFNHSHFWAGAVAYGCALPVTFGVAWFFSARLRRPVLAIILGIVSGPVAMASWAATGGAGGAFQIHLSPLLAVAAHTSLLCAVAGALILLGTHHALKHGDA